MMSVYYAVSLFMFCPDGLSIGIVGTEITYCSWTDVVHVFNPVLHWVHQSLVNICLGSSVFFFLVSFDLNYSLSDSRKVTPAYFLVLFS